MSDTPSRGPAAPASPETPQPPSREHNYLVNVHFGDCAPAGSGFFNAGG